VLFLDSIFVPGKIKSVYIKIKKGGRKMVKRAGYRVVDMTFSEFVEYLNANLGKTVVFEPMLHLAGVPFEDISPCFTFTVCETNKTDNQNVRVYGYDSNGVSHILNFWHVPREIYESEGEEFPIFPFSETIMLLSREVCSAYSLQNVPGNESLLSTSKACR
jgi:hypothetical protein